MMISEEELLEKARDLTLPDRELRKYFVLSEDQGDAFRPVVVPNPKLVEESPLEGAFLLNRFNGLAKWRRRKRYEALVRDWTGTRIVSEGDSWFQYPFLLEDVIDQLDDKDRYQYAIFSLGEAGDLLSDMLKEDEISEALQRENPHLLLISGGGNDMVGDGRMTRLVQPFDPDRPAADYPNELFDAFLNELEHAYMHLFERALRDLPHLKIVCHGYDYALPDKGRWLGKPLREAGIEDAALQRDIVAVMIDRFNERLLDITGRFPGSIFHVDCRGLVKTRWHDELHPDDRGYARVGAAFDRVIQGALQQASSPVSINLPAGASTLAGGRSSVTLVEGVQRLDDDEFAALVFERARSTLGVQVRAPATKEQRRQLEQDIEQYFEKVHRGADFLPTSFLERGVERARAVCRIVTQTSYGSGFLVASRNYIMTNNHVLEDVDAARGATAQFDYDEDNLTYPVALDPDTFFVTHKALDFTIVACRPEGLPPEVQPIPLLRDPATVTRHERVNIIQHPRGRSQEVSLHDNKVTYVYDRVIRYRADTEPGSSGSPVFNNQWELVALHHAGWAEDDGTATNEGVRLAAIVAYLLGGEHEAREAVQIGRLTPLVQACSTPDMLKTGTPAPQRTAAMAQPTLTLSFGGGLQHVDVHVR
jgi:hypothetical protein